MFGKKKKSLGFVGKRTLQQNEREYADQAMQLGHKTRIVDQLKAECAEHTARLINLHEEAKTLPTESPPIKDGQGISAPTGKAPMGSV